MTKWILAHKLLVGVIAAVVVAGGATAALAAAGAFSGKEEPTEAPTTYWDPWEVTTGATEPETTTEEETTEETTETPEPAFVTTRRTTTTSRKTTAASWKTTTTAVKTATQNNNNNGPYTTIPDNNARPTTTRATTTIPATTTRSTATTASSGGTTTTAGGSAGYNKVTGVSFSLSAVTLEKGKTYTPNVIFSPSSATNKNVRFTSSNTNVATVNASSGLITGVNSGTATITVMSLDPQADSNPAAAMTVTVSEIRVTSFEVYGKGMLTRGEDFLFTVRNFKGEGGKTPTNQTVDWATSDAGVAMVEQNGRVTGVSPGTCVITATARDGGSVKNSVTVIVTL